MGHWGTVVGAPYPLVFNGRTICTEHELLGRRGEICEASYGKIFMVEIWVSA